MSQATTWGVPQISPATPTEYATRDQDSLNALLTSNRGSARPAYLTTGFWIDDSAGAASWLLKFYDGAQDITCGTINTTANTYTPSGGLLNNISATTNPGVGDDSGDGYSEGSLWINVTANEAYICLDASLGAAVWQNFTTEITGYAASGANSDITELNSLLSINNSQIGGRRNGLFNGECLVWQRGTTFAVPSSTNTYTADRWQARRTGATGMTVSEATGPQGSRYCMRVQRDNGNTSTAALQIGQTLPDDNPFRYHGKKVTIRFKARCGANFSAASSAMAVSVRTGTGANQSILSGFSGDVADISQAPVLTTSWQTFSYTSSAVVAASGINEMGVLMSFTPVGTAGAADYIEISEIELLDANSSHTYYEREDFGRVLHDCQRYYEKSFFYGTAPAQNAGSTDESYIFPTIIAAATTQYPTKVPFKVSKRIAPTITLYNPSAANAQARNADAAADCTSTTVTHPGREGFNFSCVGPAGGTVGQRILVHWAADAEVN